MKAMMEMIKMMDVFLQLTCPLLLPTPSFIHPSIPPFFYDIGSTLALSPILILSLLCFPSRRHLDLSNNSLTTLPRETLSTAPLLESLVLQANPWSCDCRMNWFLTWSLAHPGDWNIICFHMFCLPHAHVFHGSHLLCVWDSLSQSERQKCGGWVTKGDELNMEIKLFQSISSLRTVI